MHFSFRLKLITSIALLIIVILTAASFLFVQDKEKNLSEGIFYDTLTFAELTAPKFAQAHDLFLEDGGFVYFKRTVGAFYEGNPAIRDVRLLTYDGEVLFDSATEKDSQYVGDKRILVDDTLFEQMQAFYASVLTLDGNVVYAKKTQEGEVLFVDENDNEISGFDPSEQVHYFVQPIDGREAVVYFMSYDDLMEKVAQTRIRIILLAVLGILLAILVAIFLASNFSSSIDKLTLGAAQIAKGDFKYKVDLRTGDELELLANSFNKMASELEKSTQAIVFKEKLAHEIGLAAEIQQNILPKEIPKLAGIDLAAAVIPADEIGGDVYDFVPVDEDNLMMYLGDVTGHGIPSGIVVSIANALFYALAAKKDMKKILVEVNRIVKMKTTQTMFLTLCLLNWSKSQNKLSFVSAGHEQILLYSAKDGKVKMLPSGGIALGMVDDILEKLTEVDIPMEKDDAILVYSDGIPEAWRNETESYGMARLKRIFSDAGDLPSAMAIKNTIIADVKEFTAGYKQMDDMTLLVVKKV